MHYVLSEQEMNDAIAANKMVEHIQELREFIDIKLMYYQENLNCLNPKIQTSMYYKTQGTIETLKKIQELL